MAQKKRGVRDILGPDKEDELLQSFVRVGVRDEEDDEEAKVAEVTGGQGRLRSKKSTSSAAMEAGEKPRPRRKAKIDSEALKKRKPKDSFLEVYTDKDRAAAVSSGRYDIKQSLKLKRKQDRHEALLVPEEADPGSLIALGLKEIKSGNIENAVQNISKVK